MDIIWKILIGFAAGVIAKMLTPGKEPIGFFLTAALGIAGSLSVGYLGQFLGFYKAGESVGFIGSIIGAIILLVIYHALKKKQP
jgi:uncharacterized membrane protein YeaQ/YmgE (transglycosylase-associated protein family)